MLDVLDTISCPAFLWLYGLFCLGILVLLFYSEISGWPALAKEFPGRGQPEGILVSGQILAMGVAREFAKTTMIVAPDGLYLSSIVFARFRRLEAFIPWPQVRYLSDRRYLGARWHKLDLGGIASPTISEDAYHAIEPYISRSQAAASFERR